MPEDAPLRPLLPLWAAVPVSAVGGVLLDVAFPSVAWWPMAFGSVGRGGVCLWGRGVGGARPAAADNL